MAFVLDNIVQAWFMWAARYLDANAMFIDWQSILLTFPDGSTGSFTERVTCPDLLRGGLSALYLGTDDANCVAFFHLVGLAGRTERLTAAGNGRNVGTPSAPSWVLWTDVSLVDGPNISVGDATQTTAPNGNKFFPDHTGYPVAAAVFNGITDGGGAHFMAFAAGDASAATLAAAMSAIYGPFAPPNVCGNTHPDTDIDIVIKVRS